MLLLHSSLCFCLFFSTSYSRVERTKETIEVESLFSCFFRSYRLIRKRCIHSSRLQFTVKRGCHEVLILRLFVDFFLQTMSLVCLLIFILISSEKSLVTCSPMQVLSSIVNSSTSENTTEANTVSPAPPPQQPICSPTCSTKEVCVEDNKCLSVKNHLEFCTHDRQCSALDVNSTCMQQNHPKDDKICFCQKGYKSFPPPLLCQELDFCITNNDCYKTCTCVNNQCHLKPLGREKNPKTKSMTWPFIVSPVLGILFLLIIFVPVVVRRRRRRIRYSVLQVQEEEETHENLENNQDLSITSLTDANNGNHNYNGINTLVVAHEEPQTHFSRDSSRTTLS